MRNKPYRLRGTSHLFKVHLNQTLENYEDFQKLKNSVWIEEAIDGHHLLDIILSAIYDGSHYKSLNDYLGSMF